MITIRIDKPTLGLNIIHESNASIAKALKNVFVLNKIHGKLVTKIRVIESSRPDYYQAFDAKYDSELNQLFYRRSGYNYPYDTI